MYILRTYIHIYKCTEYQNCCRQKCCRSAVRLHMRAENTHGWQPHQGPGPGKSPQGPRIRATIVANHPRPGMTLISPPSTNRSFKTPFYVHTKPRLGRHRSPRPTSESVQISRKLRRTQNGYVHTSAASLLCFFYYILGSLRYYYLLPKLEAIWTPTLILTQQMPSF